MKYNGLNFVYTNKKVDTVRFGVVPLQAIWVPSGGRSQHQVVILPRHLPPGHLVDQCVCLFSTQSINGPWDQPISFWFIWDLAQEVVKCFFEINLGSSEIPHILWQAVPQLWSSLTGHWTAFASKIHVEIAVPPPHKITQPSRPVPSNRKSRRRS